MYFITITQNIINVVAHDRQGFARVNAFMIH